MRAVALRDCAFGGADLLRFSITLRCSGVLAVQLRYATALFLGLCPVPYQGRCPWTLQGSSTLDPIGLRPAQLRFATALFLGLCPMPYQGRRLWAPQGSSTLDPLKILKNFSFNPFTNVASSDRMECAGFWEPQRGRAITPTAASLTAMNLTNNSNGGNKP